MVTLETDIGDEIGQIERRGELHELLSVILSYFFTLCLTELSYYFGHYVAEDKQCLHVVPY